MDLPPVPYLRRSGLELSTKRARTRNTHVATGEVTTLEHELGDDTVEGRALVSFLHWVFAELSEVLSGPGDILGEEVEVDATFDN